MFVPGVPLHAHERTGGKVLAIPTIFLAMKCDDNSGLKSNGVYFAIEDRCIDVGIEVTGDGVTQGNEAIREIPPMIGHQLDNLGNNPGEIYQFLDSPLVEIIRVTELANLPISDFRPRLVCEIIDEASLVVFGNKFLNLGKTPRGGETKGYMLHYSQPV